MSILWCGGEDVDFSMLTGLSFSTNSSWFRLGYARCLIINSLIAAGKSTVFPGGEITSCWFTFRTGYGTAGVSAHPIGIGKSSTTKSGLYFGIDSANSSKIALWLYDGTSWSKLAAEEGTSYTGSLLKIDINMTSYGENATVKLYVDGGLVITYSGSIAISGVSGFDCIFIGPATGNSYYFSEIIVSTTDTRNMSLVTHYPNAAGDTLAWTGAYTTIDEVVLDDSDLAYDNTDGHQALYNLSALPAGTFSVLMVKETVRACRSSDSTPTKLNIGVKSGSVDVADTKTLTEAWASYERYMTMNPVTSAAWTPAEINALQIALESEA